MMGSIIPEVLLVILLAVLVGVPYMLYVGWYVPRRNRLAQEKARDKVERLRREEAAGVPPNPADYHYAVAFDPQGFTVTNLRTQKHASIARSWSDVCRATAFKRDLFAVDCICLHLGGSDGTGVELDEEMAGWNRFIDALPVQLPGCKPRSEWYSAVAFPAFAPNRTEIYSRASSRNAEPGAAPNDGHATVVGDSRFAEGPPLVS